MTKRHGPYPLRVPEVLEIPIEMQHINSPRRYILLPAYGKALQSLRQTKPKRESFTKPFRCSVEIFQISAHQALFNALFL